jgi:hypothetical protein
MAQTLIIEFKIVYDARLLANNEMWPHFMAWSSLPGRRKHFAPVFFENKHKKWFSKPVTMRLELPLTKDNYDAKNRVYKVPLDTTIGIQARCVTLTSEGRIAIRGCGEALFPLGIELRKHEDDNAALFGETYPVSLVYHTHARKDGSPDVKGAAKISQIHAYLAGTDGSDDEGCDAPSRVVKLRSDGEINDFSYLSVNSQSFNSDIQAIIAREIAMFTDEAAAGGFDLQPSSDEEKRVHAPTDSLPPGPIMGSGFVMAPRDQSVVPVRGTPRYTAVRDWLRKLALYALRRENMSVKTFVNTVKEQFSRTDNIYDNNFTVCCGLVGQMLAIPSTSTPYEPDLIEMPIETPASKSTPSHRAARHSQAKLDRWHGAPSAQGYIAAAQQLFPPTDAERQMKAERSAKLTALYKAALIAQEESDKVPGDPTKEKIAVESFNELADYASGDCEDLGCLEMRTANTWALTDWDDDEPLVPAVSLVLRQYVPCLTLGSVRSAAFGNDTHSSILPKDEGEIGGVSDRKIVSEKKYGAHMWCLLLTVGKFFHLIQRMVPDFSLDALPAEKRRFVTHPWTAGMPDLNIEGTGYVTSLLKPAISYVLVNDGEKSVEQVKREMIERATATARIYEYLLSGEHTQFLGATDGKVTIVRPQRQQTAKPNYRLTKFYRQVTHLYTAWLMQYGYSNLNFIAGNRGARVPPPPLTKHNEHFEDNPLLKALRGYPTRLTSTSTSSAAAAQIGDSFSQVLELIGEKKQALHARYKGVFRYGVPLEDLLETPLLPATALLPGTRLDARDMRIISTLMHHAPPITMPGNWAEQWQMHEARIASRLADDGVDEHVQENEEDRRLDALIKSVDALVVGGMKWPSASPTSTLHTFIFVAQTLLCEGDMKKLTHDIEKHYRSGLIRYVRISMEEPMPHQRSVIVQFYCDPTKVN